MTHGPTLANPNILQAIYWSELDKVHRSEQRRQAPHCGRRRQMTIGRTLDPLVVAPISTYVLDEA